MENDTKLEVIAVEEEAIKERILTATRHLDSANVAIMANVDYADYKAVETEDLAYAAQEVVYCMGQLKGLQKAKDVLLDS